MTGVISLTMEMTIQDIERHCNNYFNPGNSPADETRQHPPAFLELAKRVHQYVQYPYKFTGDGDVHGRYVSWQIFFKDELASWKRARFL